MANEPMTLNTPPKPAKAEAKKADEDMLFVLDASTRQASFDASGNIQPGTGFRIHEQIVGNAVKSFKFTHGEQLELPRAIAMKFARHACFTVTDAKGNRISAVPTLPAAGEKFALGADQIIATYAELSDTALLNRVQMEAGGERFDGRVPRERLVAFLQNIRKAKEAQNKAASENASDEFTPTAAGADEEVLVAA
jgi:hypothetical protein